MSPTTSKEWPEQPLSAIPDGSVNVSIWSGDDKHGAHVATVFGPRDLPAIESRDAAIDLARQFAAARWMLAMLEVIADRIAKAQGLPEFTTGEKAELDELIALARDGSA